MTKTSQPAGKIVFPHFTSSPKHRATMGTAGYKLERKWKIKSSNECCKHQKAINYTEVLL
jgi:hypothetical protein